MSSCTLAAGGPSLTDGGQAVPTVEAIYNDFFAATARYLRRFTRCPHAAEDLAQNIFGWLLHAHIPPRENVWAWLRRIATVAGTRWRQKRTAGRGEFRLCSFSDLGIAENSSQNSSEDDAFEIVTRHAAELIDDYALPGDAALEHQELVGRLQEAIRCRLTSTEQSVLHLLYVEQLSYSEVADRLGVSRGSILTLGWRARQKIRGHLGLSQD